MELETSMESQDTERPSVAQSPTVALKNIILQHAAGLAQFFPEKTYFAPDIPQKKLANALQKYAPSVDPDRVIVLHDDTLFGGGKEGFLITDSAFYAHNLGNDGIVIRFNAIEEVCLEQELESEKDGEKKYRPVLFIKQSSGDLRLKSENPEQLHAFLYEVIAIRDSGVTRDVDGIVIVEEMRPEVKENYIKAIVNLTWDGDQQIDEREMAELQMLMTQVRTSPESRVAIRSYLFAPNVAIENLLQSMDAYVPSGSETALHFSLVKDMVRVLRSTKLDARPTENVFLLRIAEIYGITIEQIQFLNDVCENDERILLGELQDDQITRSAKEFAAKGAAVGIPIAAVYMSGSVVGLSAAGVTSGLSALGLGGILGLSSMVTGIGVAVLIGVAAYKGLKWLSSGNESDRAARREFLIQEVVRLQQQTIANLAQDVNHFAKRLVDLVQSSAENSALIDKLGRELTLLINAMDVLQGRNEKLEGARDAKGGN